MNTVGPNLLSQSCLTISLVNSCACACFFLACLSAAALVCILDPPVSCFRPAFSALACMPFLLSIVLFALLCQLTEAIHQSAYPSQKRIL
ncbi:hypothetical protein BDW66DRAFT_128402 [Aspergillus desertorum]